MKTPHRIRTLLLCGIALAATSGMATAEVADGILIDAGYLGQTFAAASPGIENFHWSSVLAGLAVLLVLIGLPVFLIIFGIKKHRRLPSVGAKLMVGTGTTICLASRARYLAADLSVEDVYSFHNQKHGSAKIKP